MSCTTIGLLVNVNLLSGPAWWPLGDDGFCSEIPVDGWKMPLCSFHSKDVNTCQETTPDDEASHPSCTLLLFGSTVVACSIYQTAEWLLRAYKEGFNHQSQQPPRSLTTADPAAKSLPREEVSRYSSLRKRVQRVWPRRIQVQRAQFSAAAEPQRVHPLAVDLANPPQRPKFFASFQRIARRFCCCFYLTYTLRDESNEIEAELERHNHCCEIGSHNESTGEIVIHDQSREIASHDQSRKIFERHDQGREIVEEGGAEMTIIPFEAKEAEAQRVNDEPRQSGRRQSLRAIAHERLQKARADEKWKETVDLTLRRLVYSLAGGTIVTVTMFRGCTTRWSIIIFGAGLGLGLSLRDASDVLEQSV